jgi:sugar/nucleoside kinase (ribokinase family)
MSTATSDVLHELKTRGYVHQMTDEAGLAKLARKVPTLVVTRSERGAVAIERGERAEVAAEPVERVIDTTGAGDLFAAGFLFGEVRGLSLAERLKLGAVCAGEIISHYGARAESDLRELVGLSG